MFFWNNESSLKALVEAAVSLLPPSKSAVHQTCPVDEHEANGVAERACRTIQGQSRTLLSSFERNLGKSVPANHAVLSWLIRRAGWLIHRFHVVRSTGMTAFNSSRGRPYSRVVPAFGCPVYYRLRQVPGKLKARWQEGVYLGSSDETIDHYVYDPKTGVVTKAFSLRLRPQECWKAEDHVFVGIGLRMR